MPVVIMGPDDVAEFNSRWPGSKLDDNLYYFFEFDNTGELVDLWCQKSLRKGARRLDTEKYDGPELLALSQDAWDVVNVNRRGNPTYRDYYFSDARERTLKLVPRDEIDYWQRLQSSTRRLIPAASSEFWRLVQSGYRVLNPYVGFRKLTRQLEQKGAYDPKALAAWIGRRKYGKAAFQAMAAAGRRAARHNPYTDMEGMALVGAPGAKPVWKALSFSGYRSTSEALSDFAMWLRSKIPHLRAYKLKSHGEIVLQNVIPESMSVAEVHHRIQRDIDYVKRRV